MHNLLLHRSRFVERLNGLHIEQAVCVPRCSSGTVLSSSNQASTLLSIMVPAKPSVFSYMMPGLRLTCDPFRAMADIDPMTALMLDFLCPSEGGKLGRTLPRTVFVRLLLVLLSVPA